MKIRPVIDHLHTYMTKLIVAFRNLANDLKTECIITDWGSVWLDSFLANWISIAGSESYEFRHWQHAAQRFSYTEMDSLWIRHFILKHIYMFYEKNEKYKDTNNLVTSYHFNTNQALAREQSTNARF